MRTSSSVRSIECPDEESLWRYSEGKLPAGEAEVVQRHLGQCSLCRAGLASFDVTASGASESRAKSGSASRSGRPAAPIPTEIDGRYAIEAVLGHGASSTVYLATDARTGEKVALKVFKAGLGERVVQELLMGRRVSHSNVCRVYDAGVADRAAYLSMEYVRGQTLAARIAEHGDSPDPDAEEILRAILAGLSAAHDAGVIHRDLKPQNILVEPDGRVVVTDFGLARLADEEESRARLVGTPSTWSPEQARGEPATFASDVYSFGVIAYRLLTGMPFRVSDASPFGIVPTPYRAMLRKALALSPSERAGTASEVAALFGKVPARRHMLAGLVVTLMVLGVVLSVSLARRSHERALVAPPSTSVAPEPAAVPSVTTAVRGVPTAPLPSLEAAATATATATPPIPSTRPPEGTHTTKAPPISSAKSAPTGEPPRQEPPDLLFGK